MAKKTKSSKRKALPKLRRLQRLTLFFFHRPRTTAVIWIALLVFGILSYTTFLKREGFPSIQTPFAMSQGAYLVNDAGKVDHDIAGPLSEYLLKQDGVKSVQTQSFDNFYTAIVSYKDNINADIKSAELQKQITEKKILPENATGKLEAFKFGYTTRGDDMALAFYATGGASDTKTLAENAKKAADFIQNQQLSLVEGAAIVDPFETAKNPATGETTASQKLFDRFGERKNNTNDFYNSVTIGINAKEGADNLELDKEVRTAIDKLNQDPSFKGFHVSVSGSNAPSITQQVNELQKTLLEGLGVVLIVAAVVIALRASFITVLSMISVIATVIGLLYVIGYSLNTITLFGLILSLSLIVDDTIIMTEALDAQRRRKKRADEVVKVASGKVGKAMVAATTTAALSFAPLIFVGGILGSFIRAIPVTIISALVISLFVALIFIPLFARYLLLTDKQLGPKNTHEFAAGLEARIARFISAPMLWAKHSKKKLFSVGIVALIIGFGFIGAGGALFKKVTFNIFPPSKDTNQLSIVTTFKPSTDIAEAQAISEQVDQKISKVLGSNFEKGSYYSQADIKSATFNLDIIDYKKRDVTAPQLIDKLKAEFANFDQAKVEASEISAGPPASAFTARIDSSTNRQAADKLANDIGTFLSRVELKRIDGTTAKIESITSPNASIYTRNDNKQFLEVGAKFVDSDTSTLVTLAQQAVEKEFPKDRVASYGLSKDAISFDFGQESENQDSFKTLALAFPLLLVVIYFVLAFQFRSLLQPLLIFMAIPFSLFGITLGLYLTDNAFSFFAMLGFFALIGLSIKNTILLTDYANQARREGMHAVDAAHEALAERFRPLIATSFTAVVSLIPLAITSPFWEGLAVVLMFGLLSSTFLVVTVFPYYYLGAEYLRVRVSRRKGLLFVVLSITLVILSVKLSLPGLSAVSPIAAFTAIYTYSRVRKFKSA